MEGETIHKKVAAAEIYKHLHLYRGVMIGAIGGFILCSVSAGWVTISFAGIGSSLMGFLLYKCHLEMKRLEETYNLEVKKIKIQND